MTGGFLVWSALGAIIALGVVLYRQWRQNSGVYRPLSSRQPTRTSRKIPLGMEATNLEAVNRVNRRNEALERGHTNWTRKRAGGFTQAADTDIDPMPDDETYAAHYHGAYQADKTRNRKS